MDFKVIFTGLIAHVQVDTTLDTRAVLVDAHHHDPILIVPGPVFVGESGDVPPVDVDPATQARRYRVEHWNVAIAGVPDVRTRRTPNFTAHVPSLPACLTDPNPGNKQVHREIHNRRHIPGSTKTYFDYKGGSIATLVCYDEGVTFTPPEEGDPRCVAEFTRYTVDLPEEVELIFDRGGRSGRIRLRRGAIVGVENSAYGSGHFAEYKKLSRAADIRMPHADGTLCRDCPTPDDDHAPKEDSPNAQRVTEAERSVLVLMRSPMNPECTQTGYP